MVGATPLPPEGGCGLLRLSCPSPRKPQDRCLLPPGLCEGAARSVACTQGVRRIYGKERPLWCVLTTGPQLPPGQTEAQAPGDRQPATEPASAVSSPGAAGGTNTQGDGEISSVRGAGRAGQIRAKKENGGKGGKKGRGDPYRFPTPHTKINSKWTKAPFFYVTLSRIFLVCLLGQGRQNKK